MPPPLGFGELYINHFIPYHLELFLCPDGSGAWEGGGGGGVFCRYVTVTSLSMYIKFITRAQLFKASLA